MKKMLLLLALLCSISALQAQWKLKGIVEDTYTGKVLKGVTVTRSHGKSVKTYETNKKGKFSVRVRDTTDVITFEKEGYYSETMTVSNAKQVKVGLTKKKTQKSGETITDSYGSYSKEQNTGSIAVLKTKHLNPAMTGDIYDMLKGRVPGLMIRRNSADPNSKASVMLRSSGTGDRVIEPLIIIDGISNFSLSSVDPNDVESIQVLKDGSAAAMYGSQAAGGVIIITTKTGK